MVGTRSGMSQFNIGTTYNWRIVLSTRIRERERERDHHCQAKSKCEQIANLRYYTWCVGLQRAYTVYTHIQEQRDKIATSGFVVSFFIVRIDVHLISF